MILLFVSLAKSYNGDNRIAKGIGRFFEPIVIYIRDEIAIPSIGEEKYKNYMSFLLTLFFFVWSTYLMIQILRSRLLDQGIAPDEYENLINSDFESALLFSIGINKDSFRENRIITDKQNSRFNNGFILLLLGVGISIALILTNLYLQ